MVSITGKCTYFNKLLFPFFKIFYTLIVHCVILISCFLLESMQPYREAINFVSYIHVVYSYSDINYTYLYAYKLSFSFS